MGPRVLTVRQVWAVQELLEAQTPYSEYAQEFQWGQYNVGDTFRLDPVKSADLGVSDGVVVVDKHEMLDDYECWSQPVYIVFQVGSLFFRITGKNKSHVGESWEYASLAQVQGQVQARTSWGRVETDAD